MQGLAVADLLPEWAWKMGLLVHQSRNGKRRCMVPVGTRDLYGFGMICLILQSFCTARCFAGLHHLNKWRISMQWQWIKIKGPTNRQCPSHAKDHFCLNIEVWYPPSLKWQGRGRSLPIQEGISEIPHFGGKKNGIYDVIYWNGFHLSDIQNIR